MIRALVSSRSFVRRGRSMMWRFAAEISVFVPSLISRLPGALPAVLSYSRVALAARGLRARGGGSADAGASAPLADGDRLEVQCDERVLAGQGAVGHRDLAT